MQRQRSSAKWGGKIVTPPSHCSTWNEKVSSDNAKVFLGFHCIDIDPDVLGKKLPCPRPNSPSPVPEVPLLLRNDTGSVPQGYRFSGTDFSEQVRMSKLWIGMRRSRSSEGFRFSIRLTNKDGSHDRASASRVSQRFCVTLLTVVY